MVFAPLQATAPKPRAGEACTPRTRLQPAVSSTRRCPYFLAVPSVFDALALPGTHGSTYGGNPLAAAVTLAALDVLEDEGLAARAESLGAHALARLHHELRGPNLREVRGRGLLMAVEFRTPCAHEA